MNKEGCVGVRWGGEKGGGGGTKEEAMVLLSCIFVLSVVILVLVGILLGFVIWNCITLMWFKGEK